MNTAGRTKTRKAVDRRKYHQALLQKLTIELSGNTARLRVRKKTISNLFRYEGRQQTASREIDLSKFDQPLYLDTKNQTLDVQGLATFEAIVNFVLPHGFAPVVTPELKHITVGGATVGIGIETNSFRYGFVHDSLLEADVLLPSGKIVLARPDNEYADLFYGLANSYGTFGYILRARIKLHKILPYVALHTMRFHDVASLLKAMQKATADPQVDYIESLAYSKNELYLTIEKQVKHAKNLKSIYGSTIFYREISRPGKFELTTRDYLFRYDPEWFWAYSDARLMNFFRRNAPRRVRKASFYARCYKLQTTIERKMSTLRSADKTEANFEHLIQDWEVPWKQARALLSFALDNLDLNGRPLMSAPVKTSFPASIYPLPPDKLYFNLGSYNQVGRKPGQQAYHYTKLMDEFCFAHDGIKMLYSSTFLKKAEFDRLYNGMAYRRLKAKYDPDNLLPTLYDKAVKAR